MTSEHSALWLVRPGGPLQVGPAPYTPPAPDEVVVRVRAVAVNPIDAVPGLLYRVAFRWVKFPTVIGCDVAGEVIEVGRAVTRLKPGDRVLGHALGIEPDRHRAAEGAFQEHVVLLQHMASPIPDHLPFEQAAVLPLALSTAATGLFQQDHLGLNLPTAHAAPHGETVLVWGGSTSVGSNAIQLARHAGYRVVTTASPRNFEYVRSLGAEAVADYRDPAVVDQLVGAIGSGPLVGSLAIGSGSLAPTLRVVRRTTGTRRVASAQPGPATQLRALMERRRGVQISAIWGGSLKANPVGPAIYVDFLPQALAAGSYRAAPAAQVVGHGLGAIPAALAQLGRGVSARKLVVTL